MSLLVALLRHAAVLLAATAAGAFVAAPWVPGGARLRFASSERAAWGGAVGLALIGASFPFALLLGIRPGWVPFLGLVVVAGGLSLLRPAARFAADDSAPALASTTATVLRAVAAIGVVLFALRALTEPMWANDFLAIWGLKGKTIYALAAVPERLYADPGLAFSHPEYPLGIPFLYAGIAALAGGWDDHAAAVLFPLIQVATLCALGGWLRRRGVPRAVTLAAAAVLALDLPLYTGSRVGLADIPLSFFVLLLGAALSDAADATDSGAPARLALASLLAVATKNEGLFLAAAALVVGLFAARGARRRRGIAVAIVLPALVVLVPHRLWRGASRLKDFDLGLLAPARWGELASRIVETAGNEALHVLLPALAILVALAALFALGRRTPWADRLLVLAACAGAAYLALPALGVLPGHPEAGPLFLVRTAVARTFSALGPLVAAGLAGRLGGLFTEAASVPAMHPADPRHVP